MIVTTTPSGLISDYTLVSPGEPSKPPERWDAGTAQDRGPNGRAAAQSAGGVMVLGSPTMYTPPDLDTPGE